MTDPAPLATRGLGPLIALAGLCLAMLGAGLASWLHLAQLAEDLVVAATVTTRPEPVYVQHAEGGAIARIAVADGDHVGRGAILIVLDTATLDREIGDLARRIAAAELRLSRLDAELAGGLDDDGAGFDPPGPANAETRAMEAALFAARRALRQGERKQQDLQRAQAATRIAGLQAQRVQAGIQIDLAHERLDRLTALAERDLAARASLLQARADLAGQQAARAALDAEWQMARRGLAEIEAEALQAENRRSDAIIGERLDLASRLAQLRADHDRLTARREGQIIRAPFDGTISGLAAIRQRQVARAAEPLMMFVPDDHELVFTAHLGASARDGLAPGDAGSFLVAPDPVQATAPAPRPLRLDYVAALPTVTEAGGPPVFEIRASPLGPLPAGAGLPGLRPGAVVEIRFPRPAVSAWSLIAARLAHPAGEPPAAVTD